MTETLLANRYRIIDKIGEGGMGRVWRVYDTVEQREVALKQFYKKEEVGGYATERETVTPETRPASQRERVHISTPSTATSEENLRFKQEFKTMVKLKHPNTVNVFDYGVLENGDDYITMEIVPGRELRDILKEKQLDFAEIYRILIQTSQVLNFIHSRLLVHQDIKPSNIRITPEGNVKLMDFGLMDQMGLPSTGKITGTVTYLPPEVAKGGIIDARSDLYSLGVMAYELVTGQLPFVGKKTLDIVRQHIETPPIPPRQIREGTSEELEEIILKLLAKDQKDRYQTTAELINDLVQVTGEKIAIETFEQRKSYLNCSELIGREKEMERLKELFTLTRQGKGQSIFIAAPAGVGKTRLIQEFKLEVQLAEISFMQGECFEQGMATYQPLADAFKPLLPLTKKEVLDKYGSVLVKVIPELKRKGYEPAPKLDEVGEKVRLFEQVTGWLKEVSEVTPIVICIEDLHWADFATLELMNACIREIKNSPIMILGTFRDDEVEPTSIIFQTVEEEITELMKLSTLNQEDVQSLIKGMLGRIELSEDFIGHLYTATAGNAFFVSEVMRALIEEEQLQLERGRWFLPIDISALELPTSIEATILRRLKVLNSDALNFAQISSIVGRDLDLFMLKELSGMDDEKLFRLLDELIGHQFIKKEEKLYAFTHDQVREILYKRIDEKKRKQLHEKAGCYLEQRYADDINAISSLLAHHFCAGLDIEKAARYSFITGMILSEKQSLVESCTHLKKAISIWEQDKAILKNEELLERAKETLAKSSLFNELNVTVELCEDLLSKLRKTPYLLTVVRLMKIMMSLINFMPAKLSLKIKFLMMKGRKKKQETEWFPREKKPARFPDYGSILQRILVFNSYLALAYGFIGSYQRSLQIIEESIEKYLPDYETPFKASLLTAQLLPNAHMGKYRKLIEVSEEAYLLLEKYCEYAKDSGPDMERQFWWGFGNLCSMQIQNFAILGKKCPDPKYEKKLTMIMENWNFQDVYFLYKCGEAIRNVYCGKHKEFLKAKEIISTLNKKMGKLALNEIWIHMWQAFLYLERGEFKNVLEFCKKAISMSETIYKAKYYIVCSIIYKSVAMFEMGEQEEAVSLLESILKECYERNLDVRVPALYYLGDFYIKLSKIPEAEAKYEEAHRICCSDEYWCDYYQINTYRRVGEIAIKKRDFERALQYLEKSIKMATDDNNPIQQGFTSLALSELYSQLGQFTKAFNVLKIAEGKFLAIDNTYQISRVKELRKQIMSKRGNF